MITILFLFSFINTVQSFAQDIEGSRDHPLIIRYPGSQIVFYGVKPNTKYNLALGPLVKSSTTDFKIQNLQELEGKLTRIQYKLNSDISNSEIVERYISVIRKANFDIILSVKGDKPTEVAGRNWVLAVYPDLPYNFKSFISLSRQGKTQRHYIVAKMKGFDPEAYLALTINKYNDNEVYLLLDVLEPAEASFIKVRTLTSDEIKDQVIINGYARLYGIYFEDGTTEIKQGSERALNEIAKFLKESGGWDFYIVGHTDLRGRIDFNLALSKNRAEAIIKYLMNNFNIGIARLTPQGVGPFAPVASNSHPEGRDLNNRFELILK